MYAEYAAAAPVRPTSEVCIKSGKGKECTCTADHGVNRAMEPGDCAQHCTCFFHVMLCLRPLQRANQCAQSPM